LFVVGCEKKSSGRPTAAEIHNITQELASAAAARGGSVKIRKSATDGDSNSRDALQISLPAIPSLNTGAAEASLLQSLDQVITRHKLTQDEPVTSANSIRILVRRAGSVTHEILIDTRASAAGSKSPGSGGAPRLAILLDDLGTDQPAAEAIFALHYPVTLSILPGHEHSTEIAQEAHRRGLEVMLHLPMESVGKEQGEAQELRPGMQAQQVAALVDEFLAKVPNVAGVNNHQGSEATSDKALMDELMPVLRDHQLFYIDSRTTAATVAYDAARQAGVPSAFRNVPLLDDVEEVAAVRKQLALALKGAKEKGEAIAIGHPHAATLQALREFLPKAKAEGIQLVPASELVH
jgi:polysaccharide deacetylase 2 family uncharacterized protein YibQ